MGSWSIEIEGTGPHHNGIPDDANAIALKAAQALVDAGHKVTRAVISCGKGEEKLLADPAALPSVGEQGDASEEDHGGEKGGGEVEEVQEAVAHGDAAQTTDAVTEQEPAKKSHKRSHR